MKQNDDLTSQFILLNIDILPTMPNKGNWHESLFSKVISKINHLLVPYPLFS